MIKELNKSKNITKEDENMNNITKVPMELFDIDTDTTKGTVYLPQIPQIGQMISLGNELYQVRNIEYKCDCYDDDFNLEYVFDRIMLYIKLN